MKLWLRNDRTLQWDFWDFRALHLEYIGILLAQFVVITHIFVMLAFYRKRSKWRGNIGNIMRILLFIKLNLLIIHLFADFQQLYCYFSVFFCQKEIEYFIQISENEMFDENFSDLWVGRVAKWIIHLTKSEL